MIDLATQDHIHAIGEWLKEDKEKRGCLLFCSEKEEGIKNAAFCALYIDGDITTNLAATMLEHQELLDILLEACVLAHLATDDKKEEK